MKQDDAEMGRRVVKLLRQAALMAQQLNEHDGVRFSDGWVDEVQAEATALDEYLAKQLEAMPVAPSDPRIVRQVGKLRVVATRARLESRWTRYLNGALLIERQEADALGAERWVEVGGLVWKEASTLERALFRLLAGDGWADRELSEYDRG